MSDLSVQEVADRVRRHFDDACFVCGRANPIGLHLDGYEADGSTLTARFEPQPHHRGAPNVLHGGVTAALLDEIMAWTGVLTERVMSVTASMEIRYRKPMLISEGPFVLQGDLIERRGRRLSFAGKALRDGTVLAESSGVYVIMHDLSDLLESAG